MRVLVTGADGFVGRHLIGRLVEAGHAVTAACRPGTEPATWFRSGWKGLVHVTPFELSDSDSVRAAVGLPHEAVVHLAAVATVREARADPGRAWLVNAAGTARLVDAMLARRDTDGLDPVLLVISTCEVYGNGPPSPRVETDSPRPQSPYAASKLGAEVAGLEAWRRAGLRVIVARPFTHTGPGQRPPYVVPSFVERLLAAKRTASTEVATGNLEPVRDLLDVRDVVEAYLGLLRGGEPGETYNIARGEGISLRELFRRVAKLVGVEAEPVPDPALVRTGDIPYLVGDARKLQRATGWSPTITLEQTLQEMVDAQAH
ncbi:MAG TPA: GDP-mannose 4,6-dehydratase [Gemmatimonadales bacterium]